MVLSLLTAQKSFADPWVGNKKLNRLGLHKSRMRLAALSASLRRAQVFYRTGKWRQQFANDGYILVENFLPADDFARLHREVSGVASRVRQATPYPANTTSGFGRPQHHPWGMDRFDGGTLNRFIKTDEKTMPETLAFARNAKLQSLCRTVVGLPLRRSNIRVYELVNGNDQSNHDVQKDFHRDTFFSSMKFWYFLDPVTPDNGPFMYVPGSHILTPDRLEWEHCQALQALTNPDKGKGGSFRISVVDLKTLGLPEPVALTVPANTLIMADTLGFHRRGDAKTGSRRLSIYSSNRPNPFFPFGI